MKLKIVKEIHNDEKTPHMHLCFTPIKGLDDFKRNKKTLQSEKDELKTKNTEQLQEHSKQQSSKDGHLIKLEKNATK